MTSVVSRIAQATHSAFAQASAAYPVQVGDTLPSARLKEDSDEDATTLDKLPGKNIVLGIPGAFTPSCSDQVPEYIKNYDEFKARGVEGIYVVSVNDIYVVKAWKESLASGGTPVHFLADDTAAFTSALGLAFDATSSLGGPRSKRFVLIVDGGRVTHKFVEENNPKGLSITAADKVLAHL